MHRPAKLHDGAFAFALHISFHAFQLMRNTTDVSVVAGHATGKDNFRRFAAAADTEADVPPLGEEGKD